MKTPNCLVYVWIGVALVCLCGKSPTAGGSSDSGNIKFAGIIHTTNGNRAAGATVVLCDENYIEEDGEDPVISATEESVHQTVTDDTGYFSFDSISAGTYYVEANDGIANAVLLKVTIPDNIDQPVFNEDTLHPYAAIEGSLDRVSSSVHRHITVFGLHRRIPVDSSCHFFLHDLPAGTYRFRITSTDTACTPVTISDVTVNAGTTLSVPCFGWQHHARINLNTTGSGASVRGSVYGFPILLRLTSNNFKFSEAAPDGHDCRFTSPDHSPLAFEIERWDAMNESAEIWVRLDTVLGNSDSQYFIMHWGNTGARSTVANSPVFDTTEGFQMVWHLSDQTVDRINDATGNDYQGSAVGMTTESIIDGIIGDARAFDGSTSYITAEHSADGKLNFPLDSKFTLSAWVNAEIIEYGSHVVISKGDEQYFLCSIGGGIDGPSWRFVNFENKTGWHSSAAPAINRQWVLLTGVRNGTTQYLYVNDELIDSTTDLLPSTKTKNTSFDLAIGTFLEKSEEGDCYFNGLIDEVRISNTVVSPDWIRLCFMNQRTNDMLCTVTDPY